MNSGISSDYLAESYEYIEDLCIEIIECDGDLWGVVSELFTLLIT